MINYNGNLTDNTNLSLEQNRGFLYGDAVFETLKVIDGKILFPEDHYFRLMASMRIIRMEIPMHFTMEYMEEQVKILTENLGISASARARVIFFRKPGGLYLPTTNDAEFIITAEAIAEPLYSLNEDTYEVDLFKDFYVTKQLLSTLKTTNKMIQITGSIFAHENGLNNCLLINDDKNVIEALQGNVFMLKGNKLVTPPITDGCLNGIMRKQILSIARKTEALEVSEESISPFDLQKADEIFITNVIKGIQPITKYRKKEYGNTLASELIKKLNVLIRLG
ncbi:aminotransferase class IV [Flavobacterium beibuense]|uniref:branched-chain-amino-acid transaminase n=1 Tax=Flavobacterium beibuense TaxID=657326 RepID=A0A444WIL4_9FLAO|nr:aminotransferase class IV [Flavobacterium beibuense]RYJ45729.1 Branched chain amino acid: 2-keto-4-methylthiobutyrate aminotransferase [Flavobacterium beibuense]